MTTMEDLIKILPCEVASITFDPDAHPMFADPTTQATLERGAKLLREGHLCAFPTETVYGLGAAITFPAAVRAIFATKGRPADNPLIVHVSSMTMLRRLLTDEIYDALPKSYRPLMDKFWPGPLSFLVPLPPGNIAPEVNAKLPTLVVRMPSHPVARALIDLANVPIAAPSANSSGRPSPTSANHVRLDMIDRFSDQPQWPGLTIVDGGSCTVGVESTVIDGLSELNGSVSRVRVLRLGGVGPEAIVETLQAAGLSEVKVDVYHKDWEDAALKDRPTTPGMKYRHYAPDAPVYIFQPLLRGLTPTQDCVPIGGVLSSKGTDCGLRITKRLPPNPLIPIVPIADIFKDYDFGSTSESGHTIDFLTPDDSFAFVATSRALRRCDQVQRRIGFSRLGKGATEHAANLFDHLRSSDRPDTRAILIERPADGTWDTGIGLAVAERVEKASAKGDEGPAMLYIAYDLADVEPL